MIGWAFITVLALVAATIAVPGLIGLITAILATIFLVRVRSVTARSRWLGILIGSAIHRIVFGGLCVVIIDTVGT